jgi:hypothetical protein
MVAARAVLRPELAVRRQPQIRLGVVRRRISSAVVFEAWQGAALRLQRSAPRRVPWLHRLVFMLELGHAGQVWAWEGSIWARRARVVSLPALVVMCDVCGGFLQEVA